MANGGNAPYGVGQMNRQSIGTTGQQGGGGGFTQGLTDALSDPNIQRFMASVGTELDPEGVGGALGRPTQQMLSAQAQQESMRQLINMLGEGGSVKQGPDGSVEVKSGKAGTDKEDEASGLEQEDDFDLDSMLGKLSGMSIESGG